MSKVVRGEKKLLSHPTNGDGADRRRCRVLIKTGVSLGDTCQFDFFLKIFR